MCPPAEPPPTMVRFGSMPNSPAFCLNQRIALLASVMHTRFGEGFAFFVSKDFSLGGIFRELSGVGDGSREQSAE